MYSPPVRNTPSGIPCFRSRDSGGYSRCFSFIVLQSLIYCWSSLSSLINLPHIVQGTKNANASFQSDIGAVSSPAVSNPKLLQTHIIYMPAKSQIHSGRLQKALLILQCKNYNTIYAIRSELSGFVQPNNTPWKRHCTCKINLSHCSLQGDSGEVQARGHRPLRPTGHGGSHYSVRSRAPRRSVLPQVQYWREYLQLAVCQHYHTSIPTWTKPEYQLKPNIYYLVRMFNKFHFSQIKSSIRLLKDQPPNTVETLLNALRSVLCFKNPHMTHGALPWMSHSTDDSIFVIRARLRHVSHLRSVTIATKYWPVISAYLHLSTGVLTLSRAQETCSSRFILDVWWLRSQYWTYKT